MFVGVIASEAPLVNSRYPPACFAVANTFAFPAPKALVAVAAFVCALRFFPMPGIIATTGRTVRIIGVCSELPCHWLGFQYDIPPFGMLSKPDW